MCRRCQEIREKKAAAEELARMLNSRKSKARSELLMLLSTDTLKGSDYIRLKDMTASPDLENLTIVEEIIKASK